MLDRSEIERGLKRLGELAARDSMIVDLAVTPGPPCVEEIMASMTPESKNGQN
jgi:hypothetical protein